MHVGWHVWPDWCVHGGGLQNLTRAPAVDGEDGETANACRSTRRPRAPSAHAKRCRSRSSARILHLYAYAALGRQQSQHLTDLVDPSRVPAAYYCLSSHLHCDQQSRKRINSEFRNFLKNFINSELIFYLTRQF